MKYIVNVLKGVYKHNKMEMVVAFSENASTPKRTLYSDLSHGADSRAVTRLLLQLYYLYILYIYI